MDVEDGRRLAVLEDDGIVNIALDRPAAGNVLDLRMCEELAAALEDARRMPALRLVVLRASGRHFSVGGDLNAMRDPLTVEAKVGSLITQLGKAVELLQDMPAPTLAVVAGTAAGGGLSLALACDIVLCADTARLVPAYGMLGASPDGGMSWQLVRRTSVRWALDFLLLSDGIGGAAAAECGLVTRSVPSEGLEAEEAALRDRLLTQSPQAVLATRRLLAAASAQTLSDQLIAERTSFLALTSTAAFGERVARRTRR
jgi:2-(1,2-epoxy-1,2-dihydrophenyl)acetyl-CoA isomerase